MLEADIFKSDGSAFVLEVLRVFQFLDNRLLLEHMEKIFDINA